MTTVSVIIPCHNDGKPLTQCLQSVLRQRVAAKEVIVVDDGGDDPQTLDLLEQAERSREVIVVRKPNGGVASARNAGLAVATGDYILWLDADDYLESGALEVLLAAAAGANADFVGGGWRNVCEDGRPGRIGGPQHGLDDPYLAIVANFGLRVGSVLVRRRPELRFQDTMPWEAQEYFLDYVCGDGAVVLIDDIVVNLRQGAAARRLTNKLDHFEPYRMGQFYCGRKDALTRRGLTTPARLAALDVYVLQAVHGLLRRRRIKEAAMLARRIERSRLGGRSGSRIGSFAWAFRWGGFLGARAFIGANRILGRA